jgi:hypothetical protein
MVQVSTRFLDINSLSLSQNLELISGDGGPMAIQLMYKDKTLGLFTTMGNLSLSLVSVHSILKNLKNYY